jgi:hypothetical protein
VLLCLSATRLARADDSIRVRELMHHALEAVAPRPTARPSFVSANGRSALAPRDSSHRTAEQTARAGADERVVSATRDAHASAASRMALHSAREQAQSAQTDANGDATRNRSRQRRGNSSDNGKKGAGTKK